MTYIENLKIDATDKELVLLAVKCGLKTTSGQPINIERNKEENCIIVTTKYGERDKNANCSIFFYEYEAKVKNLNVRNEDATKAFREFMVKKYDAYKKDITEHIESLIEKIESKAKKDRDAILEVAQKNIDDVNKIASGIIDIRKEEIAFIENLFCAENDLGKE